MSVPISIKNVSKNYGETRVINGLSQEIKAGELFTLLGPSGCGKTTLLRMIIGFNTIDGGVIEVNHSPINDIPISKRNMGMVFQNYAVFPHLTVRENVAYGLKNRHLGKEEIRRKVDHMLEVVKISDFASRKPEQLSGGQQQRVALARAIVIEPQVLLMDEPLSNLDAKLRVEMREAIKQIHDDIGLTTVYVTHDQEEALAISDRIAVMNKGVIQQTGTPEMLYRRPANVFVANFIGNTNNLEAVLIEQRNGLTTLAVGDYQFSVPSLQPGLKKGEKYKLCVRPEDFCFSDDADGIPAVVRDSVFLGLNIHYSIELFNGTAIHVLQSNDVRQRLVKGEHLSLKIKGDKINVFDPVTEKSVVMETCVLKVGGPEEAEHEEA